MENLALYRKYRPQTFSEVTGQDDIVKTLSNALATNRVAHAYLFCGPRGVGKTTTARVLARAVNCLDRKGAEPCNKCANCLAISENRAMDIIEIDAASNRGIDEARELREGIKFAPSQLKYKVIIIDECHQLTKDAANALLKTLEEPPKHAIFILATTEFHKMISTITSRCQRFDFKKPTVAEISAKLERIAKAEKVKVEKDALNLIAANASGAVRDAEVFLNQVIIFDKDKTITADEVREILGLIDVRVLEQFAGYLVKKDTKGAIGYLNEVLDKGYDPHEFAKDVINYFRQMMLLKIDERLINPLFANLTREDLEKIKEYVYALEEKDIHRGLELFLEAQNAIRYSPIPQLPIELAIVEFLDLGEK